MIATLALTAALLAPPPGELVFWRPDTPATGLEVVDDAVWRGLGTGRSEYWPLDGDPPRLMARTTPCPSTLEAFDPPRGQLDDRRLPWGPVIAHGWSDECALTSTVAGPLVRYRRWAVAQVIPRTAPARLVATDPTCTRGAVVDDEILRLFALEGDATAVDIALDATPTDLRLTAEAAIIADLEGALTLYRPDGRRLAGVDLGAPLSCAATGRGLVVAETVEGHTRAHAMVDGALRWGRSPVDGELGEAWAVDPPSPMTALAAGSRWVAAVVDGRVRIWRPAAGTVEVLPDDARDVVAGPGERLAVRGAERVTVWRLDGPTAVRGRSLPVPALTAARGPTMAWLGDGLLAAVDGGVRPVIGSKAAPVALPEVEGLVGDGERVFAVTARGLFALDRGPTLALGPARPRRGGSFAGARLDCEGRPVAPGPAGWRPLSRAADREPTVRLCPPHATAPTLQLGPDGVMAAWVVRRAGQPPQRQEARAPLLGRADRLLIDREGHVTAVLDGRAVVRWHQGSTPDRLTWVVVDGRDVIAGGGRVAGATEARRSLGWWTPDGVTSAADAPIAGDPLLMVEEAP